MLNLTQWHLGQVFKSGLSKFFKGCLPQNLLSPLLNTFFHLTVCYYDVTYVFQSESTLYSWLNIKDLLARNRHDIWSLSDSNEIRTYNHWVVNQHSTTGLVWLNGWVFVYELCGCGFESRCCHFNGICILVGELDDKTSCKLLFIS